MTSGGQGRLGQFLGAFAEGFVHTRLEILLFFLLVVALLLFFFAYFASQKRMANRRLARSSREMLEHLLGNLSLNEEETALLGRLAACLDPGAPEHTLLISHHVFELCAQRVRQTQEVSESELNALRLKIGFRIRQPEQIPASSTELPVGSSLILAARADQPVRGRLAAQGPTGMLVSLGTSAWIPRKGARLAVYFHNAAGIFSFATTVRDVMDDAVQLEHSADIARHQRRRFYRRRERLPVFVRPARARGEAQESFLLDLGGGGARLQSPSGGVKEGDLLELSFSPLTGTLTVVGRVVRISLNRKILGVKFESLTETDRNRIMGFLFAQAEHRRSRAR